MRRSLLLLSLITILFFGISAQTETLTNAEIIEMSQAGLGIELILQKIKSTRNNYDVSVKGLVELKKAKVEDDVISLIVERSKNQSEKIQTSIGAPIESKSLTPAGALRSARTISIYKDSLNPSRQALEKELLKRPEWQKLNLSISQDKDNTDLSIQIGFVPLSLITHRYVYRVFDKRSGMVITAGETTSWGSLANNLAGSITKSLGKVLDNGK